GRIDQAIEDLQRAAQANRSLPEPWFHLGRLLIRRGRYDEAVEAFQACGERDPKYPRLRLALGGAFGKQGPPDKGLQLHPRAAPEDEKGIEPRLRMANVQHTMGRYCDAREALLAARDLETDPKRRETILSLLDQVDPECRRETARRK